MPLAVFSSSPWPSWRFFLLGGLGPLAVFSWCFPHGSWVGGGACFFGSPAISCFLRLSSLAARKTWSTDPQTPRPPPALFLGASVLTRLLLGVDGRTHRGKGRGGDRGVCDPAHCLGTMIMIVCFLSSGTPQPPESTLAVSPELESILGVWLFFCVQHYNLG